MKRKIILWLSYLIAFLTVFWSCHNEDFASGNIEPQRNNANFFLHSTKGGAAAKSGVDYVAILEAYNRDKNFLSSMPDQQGMPVWDKMQVLDNGEKTVLYVPLSADRNGLSSLLIVNIDEENAVSRLQNFTNDYLETYVYNADNPTAKRKLLMDTFLQMDFLTFGHQEFTNLPKDIYTGSTDYNRLNIPEVKIEVEQSKGFIYNTICTTFHYCVHGHSTSSCDYGNCTCGGFISCFMVTSCTTTATWIDDTPFPSFPGSHGGGGGGGTPGPQPPVDPCVMNTVFYRVKPECLGNTGDPGINNIDDPCQITKSMLNRPKAQQIINDVKTQALSTLSNMSAGEIGFKEKKDGTIAPADINASHKVVFNDVTDGYGGYHNHTANGTHMFSPPDIGDTLLGFAAAQTNVRDAYFGMIAAEWCTTCPGNKEILHYVIQYTGEAIDLGNGGNYNFTAAQLTQFENKYRRKIAELSNTSLYGNTYIKNSAGDLNEKGLEKLFFETLNNMNLVGKVNLQRIESNGIINNVTLDSNGMPTRTPCP